MLICVSNYAMLCPWIWCVSYSKYLAGRNIYKWNGSGIDLKCPPVFPFPLGGTVAKTEGPRSVVLKLLQPSVRTGTIVWDYKATEWPELYKVCTAFFCVHSHRTWIHIIHCVCTNSAWRSFSHSNQNLHGTCTHDVCTQQLIGVPKHKAYYI